MQGDLCFPLQISPASTSTHLSNDRTFPNFIRTVSSSSEVVDGIIQAMKQYGWSRIALMTQSENIFTFVSYLFLIIEVYSVFLSQWTCDSSPTSIGFTGVYYIPWSIYNICIPQAIESNYWDTPSTCCA